MVCEFGLVGGGWEINKLMIELDLLVEKDKYEVDEWLLFLYDYIMFIDVICVC